MTTHKVYDTGIARQIGPYSDAVEVGAGLRWLMTAGTPGIDDSGEAPMDIITQSENAWNNVTQILEQAGMTYDDLVKVTTYLTHPDNIEAYANVRTRVLGDARPAFMLLIVPQLVRPEFLVEIEIVAAKAVS